MTVPVWGYALTQTGREPLYLPLNTRPDGAGYERNITLDQPPGSEASFVLGDGMRRITPLILTAQITPLDLQERSEEAARLYLRELDVYVRAATGVQRDSTVTRALHGGTGFCRAIPGATPLTWTATITLFPTGPAWLDASGQPVPF